ncbi:MAG TPA: class I SAM-dependent methyltransferase [Chloroflexia bacterium]|nr:class I SAM-dependent methyltransferase [Chloroflexia bacterium]
MEIDGQAGYFSTRRQNTVTVVRGLNLPAEDWRKLLERFGPSLALWRAAEIAILRKQAFEPPVLDLGCGDGEVTGMVLRQVEFGVDPWPKALEAAARRGIYKELVGSTIENNPLPPSSISTVLANSVLEHLEGLENVLRDTAKLLKPGGRLIMTVPGENFSRWLLLPLPAYSTWRNRSLIHLNLWPEKRWREELSRAGFEVELVEPYLSHKLVTVWDALELLQQVWIFNKRPFGMLWKGLPSSTLDLIAGKMARLDLSASGAGGGYLIVARKV